MLCRLPVLTGGERLLAATGRVKPQREHMMLEES